MPDCQLFSTPLISSGRTAALEWAADRSRSLPNSVVYLRPPEVTEETITDHWDGNSLELDLTPFDDLVDRLYEGSTYEGDPTYASSEQRRWLVEAALKRIDDPSNPLYPDGDPTVGLVEQAMELLTLLEFAGLDSPDMVEERLDAVDREELAAPLRDFMQYVLAIRKDVFGSELTFRSERYLHVIRQGSDVIPTFLETTDTIVVGAFQTLSPLERDLLEELSSVFDTAVVFPRVTETASPTGIDQAVSRLGQWYESIGFDIDGEKTHIESIVDTSRQAIARGLYRYDRSGTLSMDQPQDLSIHSYPTIRHEVAGITRNIRSLIADGVAPEEICIAVYDEGTYSERLAQQLHSADIPVSSQSQRAFFETMTGSLFEAVLDLGTDPDRQESVVQLLANPLVMPDQRDVTEEIIEMAERMESTQMDRLRKQLDESAIEIIDTTISACQNFVESDDLWEARQRLLTELAVPVDDRGVELLDDVAIAGRREDQESSALFLSARVCESLNTMRSESDSDEIRRAFEQITIETTVGRETDSVRIGSPTNAFVNSFSYVFAPGLTSDHTPSPTRRLAFARSLNESHPDFAAADPVRRTQYTFGLMLADDTALQLSIPEKNANSDPYVHADVLMELQRLTDIDIESQAESVATPATHEDVYRSLARSLESGGISREDIQQEAASFDIDIADAHPRDRLKTGVEVATARAEPAVGEFDGRISEPVVDQFRDSNRPFSPSSLERYASCGFKFYMGSVLDIEDEDEITIELNALDAGTYVHDVLEKFYIEWLDRGYSAVTEETIDEAEEVLYEIATTELDAVGANDTTFHQNWCASLFDGLSVPENEYGDPTAASGLFRRFLDAEVELAARDARPAEFEAHIGLGTDDPDSNVVKTEPVKLPCSDVFIHGKIDRIDLTADGDIVAYDYKTGSTPSTADTMDGLAFQLPAYLLMASDALGGEPVGAAYYQVDPGSSISYYAGTIGAEADASYYTQQTPKPLRRFRTLEFDERAEFQEFLTDDVVTRIRNVATAVQSGSFHPTVLDPGTAGCEYCEYRDACDIRHHRRHEVREKLDNENVSHYLPATEAEQ